MAVSSAERATGMAAFMHATNERAVDRHGALLRPVDERMRPTEASRSEGSFHPDAPCRAVIRRAWSRPWSRVCLEWPEAPPRPDYGREEIRGVPRVA